MSVPFKPRRAGRAAIALAMALALAVPGVQANSGSAAAAAAAAGSGSGSAASPSPGAAGPRYTAPQLAAFAKQVEQTLARSGARVAILARMGRPVADMPEGMRYTHAAFAVYSHITIADGRQVPGYAIYNLYQLDDRPDRSELVKDYPLDFFAGVAELEAGLIILSPQLQQRLLQVIGSPTYAALHEPRYSLIANPYNLGRQNCTEFVLDVVQAAIYQTSDIQVIKANTRAYFKAQRVDVNPFKLMLGSIFSAEVSTVDQEGVPVTATFERIADYLKAVDPATQVMTLRPN